MHNKCINPISWQYSNKKPWAHIYSKGFFAGLIFGELIFGGACYWKEFCISKWVWLVNKRGGHWGLRCCPVFFLAVFRWIKSYIAVSQWSQTLWCAMFVLLNLRCSVKRNYLRCCDTSCINTVDTMDGISSALWCVCCVENCRGNDIDCLPKCCITCGHFPCFQRPLGHVNHGNLKIYCGVGVSAISLLVMRCLMIFWQCCGIHSPPMPPS